MSKNWLTESWNTTYGEYEKACLISYFSAGRVRKNVAYGSFQLVHDLKKKVSDKYHLDSWIVLAKH